MNAKTKNIVQWILSVLLGLAFIGSAMGKLTGQMTQQFVDWGFPSFAPMVIGIIELIAAVMTIIPKTRIMGAGILLVIMIGAIITHIIVGGSFIPALVLGLLAAVLIYIVRMPVKE